MLSVESLARTTPTPNFSHPQISLKSQLFHLAFFYVHKGVQWFIISSERMESSYVPQGKWLHVDES